MSHVKKAEKSRVHAKQRRTEESREISEIAEQLPIALNITKRLDKGSILRLALTYLRLKHLIGTDEESGEQAPIKEADLMLDSFNGFFIIVSAKNEIVFVSENVERHMGLSQVDMLGRDIYEFVLEKDHRELKKQFLDRCEGDTVTGLGLSASGNVINMDVNFSKPSEAPVFEHQRQFFLRMRCSYQKRSSGLRLNASVSTSQTDFILLQWTGYVHYEQNGRIAYLAAVARPLQPTPIMELKMDGNMFISRHSLDLYFMYCDPRLATMLGYEPDEISGSSMYQYHHPGDLEMCGNCHSNLMTAGTSISRYYRFLSKRNEWCWLQTRATIVYNTSKQPQYIVCMNYIVSEKEGRRYLLEYFDKADTLSPATSGSSSRQSSTQSPHSSRSAGSSSSSSGGLHKSQTRSTLSSNMTGLTLDTSQYSPLVRSATESFEPTVVQDSTFMTQPGHTSQKPLSSDSINLHHNISSSQTNYSQAHVAHQFSTLSGQAHDVSPIPTNQQYRASSTSPHQEYNVSPNPANQQYNSSCSPSPQHYMTSPAQSGHHGSAGPFTNDQYIGAKQAFLHLDTSLSPQCGTSPSHQQHTPHSLESQYSPGQPTPEQSFAGSPSPASQYSSPYANDSSPTFYLPHQVKQDPEPSNVVGGNIWLSVHSLVDPVVQSQPQRLADSLIDEMEEISFQHCHSLMNETTQEAFNAFSMQDGPPLTGEDRNLRDWSNVSRIADKEAMEMFRRVRKVLHRGAPKGAFSNHAPNQQVTGVQEVPSCCTSVDQSSAQSLSSVNTQPELQATNNIRHDSMEFNIASFSGAPAHVDSGLPLSSQEPLPTDMSQATGSPELMLPPITTSAMTQKAREPSSMSFSSNMSLDDLIRDSSQSLMSLSSNVSMNSLQPISSLASDIDLNNLPPAFFTEGNE